MKYCAEYGELLDLFVDGELTPEEMERVREHLESCPGCRTYVDDALGIRAAFPDAEDTEVPEGFADGVMERIRNAPEGRKRRSARHWTGTLGLLAACCALVVLVRTGPAGGEKSAAPAGEEYGTMCYDTSAVTENAPELSPHAEMGEAVPEEPPEAPAEAPTEKMESRSAMRSGDSEAGEEEAPVPALTANMSPEAPGTMMDGAQPYASDSGATATLYLNQEEAGDLLDGFDAVWENGLQWCYQLNAEEFRALLEALDRQEEMPEEEEGPFQVVVYGPLE
ncbi:anti-sigma factor [Oscillospiraceae bacterium 38-13]